MVGEVELLFRLCFPREDVTARDLEPQRQLRRFFHR